MCVSLSLSLESRERDDDKGKREEKRAYFLEGSHMGEGTISVLIQIKQSN